jgi:hypothetical protein
MHRRYLILLLFVLAACGPSDGDTSDAADAGSDAAALASNGESCTSDDACASGTCLLDANGWTDGHCTTADCSPGSCPGVDAVCATLQEQDVCIETCQPGDCRSGYACREVSVGTAGCVPEEFVDDPDDAFEPTRRALDFVCTDEVVGSSADGSTYAFDFDVSADAESFLMVPSVTRGTLLPQTLVTPTGTTIDLRDDYHHHNTRIFEMNAGYDLAGFGTYGRIALDWPILVPYAPRFADYVESGTYELTVSTTTEGPCVYVLESAGGSTVDLNVYMVGSPDFTAQVAREDPDLQSVLDKVDAIYQTRGIALGEVVFHDVPDDVRERYRRIRSQEDAYQLTAYGSEPGESLGDRLSVDIFLVEDMVFSGQQILGLSAGLPGAAGLHGNARNGLVFRTIDLGIDNDAVAHILAHELGHFLGLRHTTESIFGAGGTIEQEYAQALGTHDPIEDTAVCDEIRYDWESCPDLDNLMFPSAPPSDMELTPRLTEGQGRVLHWSPLVE